MKRSTLFTAAVLMVGTITQAQYHEAKLDIGGVGIGSFGALYEYGINDDMGINTRVAYYSTDNNNAYSTLTFTAGFRYYFDAYEGGDGWFGTAYLKYRSLKSENWWPVYDANGNYTPEDYNSGGIALGVTTGRKWILNDHWVLESYAGIGRYLVNFGGEVPENYDNSGLITVQDGALDFPTDIRLGFIVGYRF
jgi:hypothetical protein